MFREDVVFDLETIPFGDILKQGFVRSSSSGLEFR